MVLTERGFPRVRKSRAEEPRDMRNQFPILFSRSYLGIQAQKVTNLRLGYFLAPRGGPFSTAIL